MCLGIYGRNYIGLGLANPATVLVRLNIRPIIYLAAVILNFNVIYNGLDKKK